MAFEAFLKIDGIEGESTDAKHKGEIDVLSFSWGAIQPGAPGVGAITRDARVRISDLNILKPVDKASPQLLSSSCGGGAFPTAILTVRKVTDTIDQGPTEFLKVTLSQVMISSLSSGGDTRTDPVPLERVSFSFIKIDIAVLSATGDAVQGSCSTAFNKGT